MRRQVEVMGKQRHLGSWKPDRPDHRDKLMTVSWMARMKLPAKVSLKGQPGLKIEDQADIGSCTCNSGTTADEFALRKQGVDVQLSRLWAYAEVRKLEGTPLSEDSGAEIRDVMKVLSKQGCPLEKSWPYNLAKWTVSPPAALEEEAAKHKVLMYFRCPTLSSIKASLAQGFPVVGRFSVPENMMSDECAKTGIVKSPATKEGWEGGHAVLFTGYDNATKLLQFQNSWSEAWGDSGYGYLPFEFISNGWADDFWTIRRTS